MYKIQLGHDSAHDVTLSKYLHGEIVIESERHEAADVISCSEARYEAKLMSGRPLDTQPMAFL